MNARRLHRFAVLGGAAGSALVLLAADRPWARALVVPAAGQPFDVTASGSEVVGGIVAAALVGLAAAVVLLLAGGLSRPVAAVLLAGAGAGCLFLAAVVIRDGPRDALAPALAKATGLETTGAASATAWPYAALAGSVLMLLAAGLALIAARGAGAQPRDRGRAPVTPAGTPVGPDDRDAAMDAWDALSRGEDPT